jgi:pyruvate dehydrogenase E1 component alpha subunit
MARDRVKADDVLVMRERVAEAVERARKESKPTLIEVLTYRYRGHSMSDPGKYRTAEEIEERKKGDCIANAEAALRAAGLDDAALAAIDAAVTAEVDDAVRFSEESAEPGEELIEAYTYA